MSNEVQVTNARRIVFTALALVSFWVLAWRAYDVGADLTGLGQIELTLDRYLFEVLSLTIVPMILLSLSTYDHPLRVRSCFDLGNGVLLLASVGFSYWRGLCYESGAHITLIRATGERVVLLPTLDWSKFYILLPLILTTAFVIFGAWRSAARDADEDE